MIVCVFYRRCQLVPEEHEQHDQLPDQQMRMKKFEELQQNLEEEDRPPDKPLSPPQSPMNGEMLGEHVTPESKCRQSSCKYLAWFCEWPNDQEWLLWTRHLSRLSRSIVPPSQTLYVFSRCHNPILFSVLKYILYINTCGFF